MGQTQRERKGDETAKKKREKGERREENGREAKINKKGVNVSS